MKIRGKGSKVTFDLENGYVITGEGEFLVDAFEVYVSSLRTWAPPHEHEPVTIQDIAQIEAAVRRMSTPTSMRLIFD